MDDDWKCDIFRVRVKSVPMSNLGPKSDLKSIRFCRLQLIKCALKVLAKHHSWKWWTSFAQFTECEKGARNIVPSILTLISTGLSQKKFRKESTRSRPPIPQTQTRKYESNTVAYLSSLLKGGPKRGSVQGRRF